MAPSLNLGSPQDARSRLKGNPSADLLLSNAGEIFTGLGAPLSGAAVAITDGLISWVGPQEAAPQAKAEVDLAGRLLTPGLVECHTHVVFAGDRAGEYARRAAGADYLEIAAAGGGIAATMRATREASVAELVALARPRLHRLLAQGVTTCEIKSGYGLSITAERNMLEAIAELKRTQPIEIVATFLGAHTIPPDRRADRAAYLDEIVEQMIPAFAEAGLAEFCDVFVEQGAFTLPEAERVLRAGLAHGLRPKVHADQLSAGGGAQLAASLNAVSADHLERITPEGIAALAGAGTVAVLLPGAALFLGEDARPPARALIEAGVRVALSTDCNPGTCMTENLQLMLTLGMSRFGMTPREALEAITINAAHALARGHIAGAIAVGRPADLAVFDVPDHVHLPYHFGVPHTWRVYRRGESIFSAQ